MLETWSGDEGRKRFLENTKPFAFVACCVNNEIYRINAIFLTDLWGDVIWSPAEGACGSFFKDALLTHAKVCQLAVSVFIKKNIVQLQIPGGREGGRRD